MTRLKKVLVRVSIVLAATFVLLLLLISPIAKYLIQKYDTRFTGREITLDWAYVNPFTGYVYLHGLEIMEHNGDTIFLKADGLMANMAMLKLFNQTYEISAAKLTNPIGRVHQSGKEFNFSDLIEFYAADTTKAKPEKVTRFSLLDIEIENGEFHYIEALTPVNYFIKEVNIKSDGLQYDKDTMPISFSFLSGTGSGKISGDIAIHLKNSGYALGVVVDSFDLDIINQYLKDLTNYGTFAAKLDAELNSTGNFRTADSISTSGNIAVTGFQFGRHRDDDFASFESLIVSIDRLSPKDFIYRYDSVCLTKPFFKYQRFDTLDNVQTMFGVDGQNVKAVNGDPQKFNLVIEIAHLIDRLSRNFLNSQYQVGRFAIYDGDLQYEDYSMGEKFSAGLEPFTVIADSVDKANARVNLRIHSGIKPHGNFNLALSVDPKDSSYFNLDFFVQKVALSMMNPFLVKYTGFPLVRGAMELRGYWVVRNGSISSLNHLIILDPRVSERVHGDDTRWLPLNFAMALVREKGNVIDYEVPISGKLGDPAFNFWDVIRDIFTNIVLKPISTPYRMNVKMVELELESNQQVKWPMHSSTLSRDQKRYIDRIVDFLKSDEKVHITIYPAPYEEKEKELLLLFEAKKLYYFSIPGREKGKFSEQDSLNVAHLSVKDPGFQKFLNAQVTDKTLFTVQHKAAKLVSPAVIQSKYDKIIAAREKAFKKAFIEAGVNKQVAWGKTITGVPFNGFSHYSISYKGHVPDYLQRAYKKMDKYNADAVREPYRKERKRNE
ncbi:MAG: DUF748 domain-containing protein [Bacteroidia bacterium]